MLETAKPVTRAIGWKLPASSLLTKQAMSEDRQSTYKVSLLTTLPPSFFLMPLAATSVDTSFMLQLDHHITLPEISEVINSLCAMCSTNSLPPVFIIGDSLLMVDWVRIMP